MANPEVTRDHKEVTKKLSAANRTFFPILLIMKSRNVHRETKLRLYKILTIVSYRSEAWTITIKTADRMDWTALKEKCCAKFTKL